METSSLNNVLAEHVGVTILANASHEYCYE